MRRRRRSRRTEGVMLQIFMWLKSQKIMTLKFKDGPGEVNMSIN